MCFMLFVKKFALFWPDHGVFDSEGFRTGHMTVSFLPPAVKSQCGVGGLHAATCKVFCVAKYNCILGARVGYFRLDQQSGGISGHL